MIKVLIVEDDPMVREINEKFLKKVDLEKVGRLNLDKATKVEIQKILATFMDLNYRRKPKSLSLLK